MRKFPICWWCILLAVLTVTACNQAFAASPITGYTRMNAPTIYSSPEAACSDHPGWLDAPGGHRVTPLGHGPYWCEVFVPANNGWSSLTTIFNLPNGVCANGSAPNTSLPTAQQCPEPVPECTQGKQVSVTFKTGTGPLGSPHATVPVPGIGQDVINWPESDGKCNVALTQLDGCEGSPNAANTEQEFFCTFSGKQTGTPTPQSENPMQPSSPAPNKPVKPAEITPFNPASGQGCPGGTTAIGVDSGGTTICAGTGVNPSTIPKEETKSPPQSTVEADGTTVETTIMQRVNADGSTTTYTRKTFTSPDGTQRTWEGSETGDRPASQGGGPGRNDKASQDDIKGDTPVTTGQLYAKKEKTFQSVFGNFKATVEGAPMVAAAKGFLTVNVSGGSCPSWSANVPYLNTTISMGETFCSPTAYNMYAIIAIGLLIGASYMAFRMAFL